MVFKKRPLILKFTVDIQIVQLTDVSLLNGILFAKVKLNENGKFRGETEHKEVNNHRVNWEKRFQFPVKIATDPSTGVLKKCIIKISIQREAKGGKIARKLGFADINLSEFAASGVEGIEKGYLLDGYGGDHRQDNSRIIVRVTMLHNSADPFFKVPSPKYVNIPNQELNPSDRKAPTQIVDIHRSSLDISVNNVYDKRYSSNIEYEEQPLSQSSSITPVCQDITEICSYDLSTNESGSSRRLSDDRLLTLTTNNNTSANSRVQRTRVNVDNVIAELFSETEAGFQEPKYSKTNDDNIGNNIKLFIARSNEEGLIEIEDNKLKSNTLERVDSKDTS
ncbi:EEIG1/EHBP1 N-terminal domain-containing protein [Strongyloides ratti]|uniref:EEIG1/EHBP1 N-terminal domain-containing protein n=1 Tax=Strongyloides ratti TaxID=34506 RepID=A0A090MW90_STRRB|nr:EEIG1/EHBP1 N-terminal domain-containing protein [Strongyloides ratti]CEF63538.1 EEIG1/EHBP1 N-terminal domain-containing protein [Strongyloides ratti]